MKLKDLRNLHRTVRNINLALILLGIGMVIAMCTWCVLFQADSISTIQWVTLELTTMAAIAFDAFILNFFCDVNRDISAKLAKAIRKWHQRKQKQARIAAARTTNAIVETMTAEPNENPAEDITPEPKLQAVGG